MTGCRLGTTEFTPLSDGRLTARPGVAPTAPITPGIHDLHVLGSDRHCWLIVPEDYDHSKKWPLAMFFRGAITLAENYMAPFQPIANEMGMLVLAPECTGRTWDLILWGEFGPDVEFINKALHTAYQTVHVDPARIFTSGFSDGASYSLSLGLTNGDFIRKIAAYSPGFMRAASTNGHPSFFFTHGRMDQQLPVEASQIMVEELRSAGYDVEYREFDGPHAVSLSLMKETYKWMLGLPYDPGE